MGFKDIFKTAFPFISAAASIGGPLGTMAAAAVGKALNVDNVPPNPDGIADAITAATSKDPDAMLKLKQAEEAFQLQMTQLGFENAEKLEEVDAADRANARQRQEVVKDKTPTILAAGVTIGFFSLLALIVFYPVPIAAHDLLMTMVGVLGTAWTGIITYYFGSSAGSDRKTELLAKSQPSK